MARFRTLEQITFSMLDFIRLAQPDADVKPGSVIRDIMIDLPASEISKLYDDLRSAPGFQNIYGLSGSDLDRFARNYGIIRRTGTLSSGSIVFTTNNLDSNVAIGAGTVLAARNGLFAKTTIDIVMDASKPALYRSVATRLASDLALAGITDTYAIEVAAQSTSTGSNVNFGRFQLRTPSVPGISNATNVTSFSGGTGLENDSIFRARILAIWAGANIGSSSAYLAAVLADSRVLSARVVEPGDTEMLRDGSVIGIDSDGNEFVISPGTGGKADIVIMGEDIQSASESFIYVDRSGKSDATDFTNNVVLGQRNIDPELTYQQRRKAALDNGTIPFQPVSEIVGITGSLSGPNFKIDENFTLEKDTGTLKGSSFGKDSLSFTSNTVQIVNEQIPKIKHNSVDALDYSDVVGIEEITSTIQILREVATLDSSNRAIVTVQHTPVKSVDKVVNATTGERYRIASQNLDGDTNTSGRIQISGSTLPRSTDIVEVSYLWENRFDSDSDYDSIVRPNRIRTAQDSVDWGFANRTALEPSTVVFSVGDGYHVLVEQPISRVVNVLTFNAETLTVADRQVIASNEILDVLSVTDSNGQEVFFTKKADGSVSGFRLVLPTDSVASDGSSVVIRYNTVDIYSPDGVDTGTASGSKISLPNYSTAGTAVLVDYVVDQPTLMSSNSLASFPLLGSENDLILASTIVGTQPSYFDWLSSVRTTPRKISPTYLQLSFSNVPSAGRLLINGLISKKIELVYTAVNSGLTQNLYDVIFSALGSVPSDLFISSVVSVKKVTRQDTGYSDQYQYDTINYKLKNSLWDDAAITDSALTLNQFRLQDTEDNLLNQPLAGDLISISLYVVYSGFERVSVQSSGVQYSKNKFVYIDEIRVDSGFRNNSNLISGELSISPLTQPDNGSQYSANYDFIGPKEGERLTIEYRYNRLPSDMFLKVETVRPIGADVLIKESEKITIDIALELIVSSDVTDTGSVKQAVIDRLISFVSSSTSAGIIDASDIINECYSVPGTDRVILTLFNYSGQTGIRKTIKLKKDQFFAANTVTADLTSR